VFKNLKLAAQINSWCLLWA